MSLFGKDTYNYINNEIDYDKLAEAIVKAQQKAKEQQMNDKEQLLSLFTAVVAIIPLVEIVFNFLKGMG